MADGRSPDMFAVDILKATQQRTEPVRCKCRWGCILAQPGEYDWTVHVRRRCGLLSYYFEQLLLLSDRIALARPRCGLLLQTE